MLVMALGHDDLIVDEALIVFVRPQQFFMSALSYDLTFIEDEDLVGVSHCGETMSYDDRSFSGRCFADAFSNP